MISCPLQRPFSTARARSTLAVLMIVMLAASLSSAAPPASAQPPLAVQATVGAPPADPTAFVNVTVVPMDTERTLPGQAVVVEGSRITALGPLGTVTIPAGAVRVDGQGKFLVPGLSDCHAHSSFMLRTIADSSDRLRLKEQMLFRWLAHGLTTVRVLDHTYPVRSMPRGSLKDMLRLRDRARAGAILSPRIYTSGYLMDDLADSAYHQGGAQLRLDDVVEAIRTYQTAGYDFIKMHHRVAGRRSEAFDSVAAVARRVGLPLGGHAMVPLARVLETYEVVDHLTGYISGGVSHSSVLNQHAPLEELTPRMRELAVTTQRAGVWNCPTLTNTIEDNPSDAVPPRVHLLRALQKAGAGLLAGTDNLHHGRKKAVQQQPGAALTPEEQRLNKLYGDAGAIHRELWVFVEMVGLTPYEALATGTRNMAAMLGALDSTGTVAVGKRADLLLLDGNPLVDIRQTARIAGVMLGGRWLDRAALDQRTAAILAWMDRWCAAGSPDAADHRACTD